MPERSQKILAKMAEEGDKKFRAREFDHVEQYPSYLKTLYENGLVNREEYGIYSAYHPLFLEWIQEFVL